ncbi:hypothetical protein C8F04DRAFT_1092624 [Mycena alexandri]|uniref:BTB domain-containing protein n=1 Tax=Mycena alexandri TaxID=1745969 RepID=A0AAD6T186_9AGAR|nr:hypothetical protein C8F04DRAFT_1092624 [Mycena alexandri]
MSDPLPDITPAPEPFVTEYPFTKAPGADAILRSADGADFYVHRVILSLVSPVFETMFQLPQPDAAPAVPVIDVQETSAVLDRALRFFYPGAYPRAATLEEVQEIIKVLVSKYDVQSVVPVAKQHLEKFCSARPLAVYAIAFQHRWQDVATLAAKESLKLSLRTLNTPAPPELNGMTAIAYHDLLHYHYLCGTAAQRTAYSLLWLDPPRAMVTSPNCVCHSRNHAYTFLNNARYTVPEWFNTYLTSMAGVLTITPGAILRENYNFYVALGQAKCVHCTIYPEFITFVSNEWPAKLAEEMDKIELKF